jgi:hypothetical protein
MEHRKPKAISRKLDPAKQAAFIKGYEFERELIAERTTAGLAAARARGRMGGRPRKMNRSTLKMAMAAMADHNAVAAKVARQLGFTTTTLYVYVNGDGTLKAAGQALLDGPLRGGKPAKTPLRSPQPRSFDTGGA